MRITKRQLRKLIKESADDLRIKKIAEQANRLLVEDKFEDIYQDSGSQLEPAKPLDPKALEIGKKLMQRLGNDPEMWWDATAYTMSKMSTDDAQAYAGQFIQKAIRTADVEGKKDILFAAFEKMPKGDMIGHIKAMVRAKKD